MSKLNGLSVVGAIGMVTLALATPAQALSINKQDSRFALFLERQEVALHYDTQTFVTDIESLYIMFAEPMVGGGLMGMNLGQLGVTQNDNPDTRGVSAAGYRLGLWMEREIPAKALFQIRPRVYVDYGRAQGGDATNGEIAYNWREYGVIAMLQVNFSNITIGAGPVYDVLSGQQKIGSATGRDFNAKQQQDWVGTLRFLVSANGYVGIDAAGGDNRKFGIYFERKY